MTDLEMVAAVMGKAMAVEKVDSEAAGLGGVSAVAMEVVVRAATEAQAS